MISFPVVDENFRSIADDYIFHDTIKDKKNRIIFYSSQTNLNILENAKVAAADGTFKVKKKFHRQILTIHGELDNRLLPLVFVYMKSKKKVAYKKVFKIIKKYIVSFFFFQKNLLKVSESNSYSCTLPTSKKMDSYERKMRGKGTKMRGKWEGI